jgi:hypothetical protein
MIPSAVFRSKFQPLAVTIGKGADAKIDSRKVESFAGPELAAHLDSASHVPPFDLHHLELYKSIVEKKSIPRFYGFEERFKGDRNAVPISSDLLGRKGEGVTGF